MNNLAKTSDKAFTNRVSFLFQNNKHANTLFINEIKNKEYSDFSLCSNISFDIENLSISLNDKTKNGTYVSSSIKTFETEESLIDKIFLIIDINIPIGCDVEYFILTDLNDKKLINPNDNTPLKLKNLPTSFRVVANLFSNGNDGPSLNSLATMYFDSVVNDKLGLVNRN